MTKQTQSNKENELSNQAETLTDEELDQVNGGYLQITMANNVISGTERNNDPLATILGKKVNSHTSL